MTEASFAPVLEAVRAAGWSTGVLDLAGVTGKAAFLERCARALDAPGWFGRNWDALADGLKDLSWLPAAPGRLLLAVGWQEYAAAQPAEWVTAQEVFAEAEAHWSGRPEGFAVLLAMGAAEADRG
ncbi:barstar family protein [Streptomyces sp. TS71-3]|uniref:barstar family protein n=1 Tax=Streptomyces sp. TS71-3 TaxID=2733862 RepID=UPI001B1F3BE2|nr:barstar family protein [Streptomyces sp. TS71-3]GHJ38920.1 hypothetical protein Sm713_45290 [Streptomyces sp. TS71-3]